MLLRLLFLILFSANGALAKEIRGNWVIDGKDTVLLLIDSERYVWASASCHDNCMWWQHRMKYEPPLAKNGGANPFNQLCTGPNRVVVSSSPRYGTLSFCLFTDGSIMSTNGFVK